MAEALVGDRWIANIGAGGYLRLWELMRGVSLGASSDYFSWCFDCQWHVLFQLGLLGDVCGGVELVGAIGHQGFSVVGDPQQAMDGRPPRSTYSPMSRPLQAVRART